MTTNNDTPQMSGEDVRHDAVLDPEWRDRADDAAQAGTEVHEGPNGPAEPGWAGGAGHGELGTQPGPNPSWFVYPQGSGHWDQAYPEEIGYPQARAYRHGPAYPDGPWYPDGPGYPDRLGYPEGSGYPEAPGYPHRPGLGYPEAQDYPRAQDYPQEQDYPRGPGYAPVPRDYPGPGEHGYPAGARYEPEPGYAPDPGYPQDASSGRGSGFAPDPGYAHDLDAVPPMEPLGDQAGRAPQAPWDVRAGQAPWPGSVQPHRVPSQRMAAGLTSRPSADPDYEHETTDSLTAEALLHGKRPAHGSGWRRSLYRMTGGLLRFGESAADMHRRDLINRVRTPVAGGHHRVAVLSLKGGVGKTTTAVGLGATLATLRGDRVIAVDANPDRGTLSDKVRLETAATVRDLLNERVQIRRYADARAFTSQAPSRLEVLASDRDPGVSVAFGADDYCDAARVLEHFYSICITDCGTGLLHSAMSGVLHLADQLVVVSSPSVDGARSASATLDWLEAHNCGDLVRNGVVVLSAIRPKSKSTVDLDRLEHHFAARCRAVARIPYDPHLEEGAEVELELLSSETADAYLTLAALVGDGLAWPRRLTYRSALPYAWWSTGGLA